MYTIRRAEDWVRCSPAYTVQLGLHMGPIVVFLKCLISGLERECCSWLLAVGTFWNTSLISGPKYPGESYARAFHSKCLHIPWAMCTSTVNRLINMTSIPTLTRTDTHTNLLHMAQMPNKWQTQSAKLTWSVSEFIKAQSHTMTAGPGKVCSHPCYTQTVSPSD